MIRRERGLPRVERTDPVEDIEPPAVASAPTHGDSGPLLKAPAANHQE